MNCKSNRKTYGKVSDITYRTVNKGPQLPVLSVLYIVIFMILYVEGNND